MGRNGLLVTDWAEAFGATVVTANASPTAATRDRTVRLMTFMVTPFENSELVR